VHSIQANPNKTKPKSLDLLGFIRPNRDFSKGYERKNKKSTRVSSCMRNVSSATHSHSLPRRRGAGFLNPKTVSVTSDFVISPEAIIWPRFFSRAYGLVQFSLSGG
jgi:hypothetical protein